MKTLLQSLAVLLFLLPMCACSSIIPTAQTAAPIENLDFTGGLPPGVAFVRKGSIFGTMNF